MGQSVNVLCLQQMPIQVQGASATSGQLMHSLPEQSDILEWLAMVNIIVLIANTVESDPRFSVNEGLQRRDNLIICRHNARLLSSA